MRILLLCLLMWLEVPARAWTLGQAQALAQAVAGASAEGLDPALFAPETLAAAMAGGEGPALDSVADGLFRKLASAYAAGVVPREQRKAWHLPGRDGPTAADAALAQVRAGAAPDEVLARLLPGDPAYQALRAAYAATPPAETGRRTTLAVNMERWRWLPPVPSGRLVWVNVPAFSLHVLEDGRDVRVHRLIVGKPRTPTPQFATKADAVILNPDWVVPASIQKEGIAQMVARNPAAARAKGYVRTPTGITQLPGPANQLGAMKLRMPNPYGVYIHDTPAKSLFARQKRALSHGCMRVELPLVLADALLGPASPGLEALQARVKTARTETLPLPAPVPLWVVYLTAVPGPEPGGVRLLPDVYGRDAAVAEALRGRPRAAVAGAPLLSSECSEVQAA